jgi:hypothetical protein
LYLLNIGGYLDIIEMTLPKSVIMNYNCQLAAAKVVLVNARPMQSFWKLMNSGRQE